MASPTRTWLDLKSSPTDQHMHISTWSEFEALLPSPSKSRHQEERDAYWRRYQEQRLTHSNCREKLTEETEREGKERYSIVSPGMFSGEAYRHTVRKTKKQLLAEKNIVTCEIDKEMERLECIQEAILIIIHLTLTLTGILSNPK